MLLSIVICTYNRKPFLELCLNSIIDQTEKYSEKKIEVIVIDNNSSDNTKQFIYEYKSKKPIIYFLEKKQGLSYARNTGIELSKGEYIAFIDDDATINEKWLDSLLGGIKNTKSKVFGGPIYPRFEIECPKWIDTNYFVRKFKNTNGYLSSLIAKEGFSGGNMCIHNSVFETIGRFNINLGMKGKILKIGEETEFFNRLSEELDGEQHLYNLQDMSITHFEAAYKLEKSYLRKRIILSGENFSIQNKNKNIRDNIKIYLKIVKQSLDFLINIIRIRKFKYLKNIWVLQGLINGLKKDY